MALSMLTALLRPRMTFSAVKAPDRTGAPKSSSSEGNLENSSSAAIPEFVVATATWSITGQSTPCSGLSTLAAIENATVVAAGRMSASGSLDGALSAAAVASVLLYTRSYPDSVAASIDAVRSALSLADANPGASEPVLRLSRVLADLDFRGRVGRREGGELLEVCEIVGRELALADGDIADRYFGGVAMPIHVT